MSQEIEFLPASPERAQEFLLPALVMSGADQIFGGCDNMLAFCDTICDADPPAAVVLSGFLMRGEQVPEAVIERIRAAVAKEGEPNQMFPWMK